jgi:SAM-dependent methyltransferase
MMRVAIPPSPRHEESSPPARTTNEKKRASKKIIGRHGRGGAACELDDPPLVCDGPRMLTDRKIEPNRVVFAGYDHIADAYLERFRISAVRQKWLCRLLDSLPPGGGRVLDLGCGAGVPVARDLDASGHIVVGVDGSAQQIVRARRNVPKATLVEANMCEMRFDADSFDAVGAFYSMTHLPPAQQGTLIDKIATWLKPGGVLIASFGTGAPGEWIGEWLGTEMFFGHCDELELRRWLTAAGLDLRRFSVEKQDNEDVAFLWIEAVKKLSPG